jgi:hypothetical protein
MSVCMSSVKIRPGRRTKRASNEPNPVLSLGGRPCCRNQSTNPPFFAAAIVVRAAARRPRRAHNSLSYHHHHVQEIAARFRRRRRRRCRHRHKKRCLCTVLGGVRRAEQTAARGDYYYDVDHEAGHGPREAGPEEARQDRGAQGRVRPLGAPPARGTLSVSYRQSREQQLRLRSDACSILVVRKGSGRLCCAWTPFPLGLICSASPLPFPSSGMMEYHSFPVGSIHADDHERPRPISQWTFWGEL